ncbi:MAG TPA: hypothetical protein VFI69_11150 [Candidatus Limnocylindrales bacterium]|nr:hypothetical protein [Candidatus Limnocylindrales bacterium]
MTHPPDRRSATGLLVIALLVAGCGLADPTPPSIEPSRSATPPTPSPSLQLLSKADAEAIARSSTERWADGDLLDARFGTYADFVAEHFETASPPPAPGAPVWWISLGDDPGPLRGQGEFFVIDATDGRVIQHYDWIS